MNDNLSQVLFMAANEYPCTDQVLMTKLLLSIGDYLLLLGERITNIERTLKNEINDNKRPEELLSNGIGNR